MKIVINKCHGGYGFSEKAVMRYAELSGINLYSRKNNTFGYTEYYKIPVEEFDKIEKENPTAYSVLDSLMFFESSVERNDPILIQVVEELGDEANCYHSKLKVVEIPDHIQWNILVYDGIEIVVEKYRSWS
jgi:hypothetical protein